MDTQGSFRSADTGIVSPFLQDFGPFHFVVGRSELRKGSLVVPLNGQEWRLLVYLVSHPNRVLDRSEILERVWGYGTGTATRTVDVHIAKLRHRLGESKRPVHILTARGRGYLFRP